MSERSKIRRRGFVRVCAGAAIAVGANPRLLAAEGAAHRYRRVKLVDKRGTPITPDWMKVGASYVFNYPYVTTPCFLLDLGKPAIPDGPLHTKDGVAYEWPGGIGPGRSIVAFAAICAHKMSYPSKQVSFINYRPGPVTFRDEKFHTERRAGVIYCCSEKSVYDPAHGARVLGGPAPQPLAAILLEHDAADGALYAAGTFGGEMYRAFFKSFSFRITLEYGGADVHKLASETSAVVPIAEYSANMIMC